ncbi:AraC family transcriptional regulator [Lentisphaera profundi]|uniref:AraC family transcriptional regulator n=1 Tax=Lentisphaera profundi TaxID=1658616 RepID=A0ABY7VU54_9BACT|nr:AraC family transcriptional regulator [Lentisphaera profundi]WDE97592.1 AraC family transcriptional regulator [Lentisphaera profundi]
MLFGKNNMVHRYFGDSAERVGLGLINKTRGIDHQNFKWPWYAVVFILKGHGHFIDHNQQKHTLSEGMFFQRIPGLVHSNIIESDDWQEIFFDFGVKTYEMLKSCEIINPQKLTGHCPISLAQGQEHQLLLEELKQSTHLKHMHLKILSFFQDIQSSSELTNPLLIDEACAYLEENFLVKDKIQNFCIEKAVGYEMLRKKFKEITNSSPKQFQNRVRMEKAIQLLGSKDFNIEQIANQLGYCSSFEFSKQFKKFNGISPGHYRNNWTVQTPSKSSNI